jgi:hypothetical protein
MSNDKTRDPIPEEFDSPQAAGDFWDTHSLADYWDETEEVHFEVDLRQSVYLIPVERIWPNLWQSEQENKDCRLKRLSVSGCQRNFARQLNSNRISAM